MPAHPDIEYALNQLIEDPIVRLVMKADKVDERGLRKLLVGIDWKLSDGSCSLSSSAADSIGMESADTQYRRGVGIMLLNERNEVLVGRRINTQGTVWQMPQGGIDPGETPRAAVFRELREEIGTSKAEIVAESVRWLRYDLPPELVGIAWGGRWRGQLQKWFVLRFTGEPSDINVSTEHPEFDAWKWASASELPDLAIQFKRQLYVDRLKEFGSAISPPPDLGAK